MMLKSVSTNLSIDDTVFNELISMAFSTLPVNPFHLELSFMAEGVREPIFKESKLAREAEKTRYYGECESRGITPGTERIFTYDDEINMFIASSQKVGINLPNDMPRNQMLAIYNGFFGGQKTHAIKFQSGSNIDHNAYLTFVGHLLDDILANEYKLRSGTLSFEATRSGIHSEGFDAGISLYLNSGDTPKSPKRVILSYPRQDCESQATWVKLRQWNKSIVSTYK